MAGLLRRSPLVRRVVAGMGANAFGQATYIVIQLVSLPMFLSHWDAPTYGVWLMLSAACAYVAMADAGMVMAASNDMTMAVAAGQNDEAHRIFQSAVAVVGIVCVTVAVLALGIVTLVNVPGLQDIDRRVAFLALTATLLLAILGGLTEAILRATGRYPLGTFGGNVVRLGEWLGSVLGLVLVGSFTAVAVGGLLMRLAGFVVLHAVSLRESHGIRWGWQQASWARMKAMARPAAWFMVFPLANALSFQGATLVVGQTLGAASVVTFNAYRTLARVTVQLTSVFSHSLGPEFARLYGTGALGALRQLYRRSFRAGSAFALVSALALLAASSWLLQTWSRGAVHFDLALMIVFVVYAALGALWHVPRTLLMSINRHGVLAGAWALVALASLGLVAALAPGGGLMGAAFGIAVCEVVIVGLAAWQASAAASDAQARPLLHDAEAIARTASNAADPRTSTGHAL